MSGHDALPDHAYVRTQRLRLDAPRPDDVAALFALESDPRVWTHFPSGRATDPAQSARVISAWREAWAADGLGPWIVRGVEDDGVPGSPDGPMIGYCGCRVVDGAYWNLGYRFSPAAQGRGYGVEAARAAIEAARATRPDLPVVAYLLEHNTASARLAERAGLVLRHRAPDAGNPDPAAIRLVYADRELTPAELATTLA
ncbi:GNAT family N-acetyltransferase [Brachybacterium huguangmaarense]